MKDKKLFITLGVIYLIILALVIALLYWIFRGPTQTEMQMYVEKNITSIIPEDPVLGGTWYMTDINFDPLTRTGTATYEDGHIQGSFVFQLLVDSFGQMFLVPRDYVTLSVGDEKFLKRLDIKFNELVADNRCPVNANCIEAGAVTVNLTLTKFDPERDIRGETPSITLNKSSDEVPLEWEGHKISIVKVKPVAMSNQAIDPMDYQVTLKVE